MGGLRVSIRAASMVLVGVVAALLVLAARDERIRSDTRIGVTLDTHERGAAVLAVTAGDPADRAGLLAGDVIVEMAGERFAGYEGFSSIAIRFERGVSVPVVVDRDGVERRFDVVPGTSADWTSFSINAFSSLVHVALALLALRGWGSDLRARLLSLLASAVAIELALPVGDVAGVPAEGWQGLDVLLDGLQLATELHLASVIPEAQGWLRRRPRLVLVYYGLGVGLGVMAAFSLWTPIVDALWPIPRWTPLALFEGPMLVLWALAVPLLLARQALTYPTPTGRHRAGLVMVGGLPWTLLIFAEQASGWSATAVPDLVYTLWPVALLAYPAAVFVAVFRYQLFDLELVVRRSLLYAALSTVLLVLFYVALGAGGALFVQRVDQAPSIWLVAGVTLVLGLLFAPLRRLLFQLVDRRFFPERYALRQRLIALAAQLPALGQLPAMGRHLCASLCEIFHARSATLLIADPKSGLLVTLASTEFDFPRDIGHSLLLSPDDPGVRRLRTAQRPMTVAQATAESASLGQRLVAFGASLVVPVVQQEELVGLLLLGEKRDRERYPAEEQELLSLLSHHVATVLENARLFQSATYESLTGMLRREAILDLLGRELQRAQRYQRPLTIGMADLDHFKEINDRHGHLTGDALLQRVAQVVNATLRSTDAVGRYGGEEFLLVLPETEADGARAVAEKVRQAVERLDIETEGGRRISATLSIGLAGVVPGLGSMVTVRELLRSADDALFEAKRTGRNRVHAAESSIS